MLPRLVLAAALVAGCYAPSANPGAPCSASGLCPSGQECRSGVCFATGAPHDGDVISDDAPVDMRIIDAPADGPAYVAWGTPAKIMTLESTGTAETDPSITADKLTVATVAANDDDLFIATRAVLTDSFTIATLPTVSAFGFNGKSPEISGDGKTLFFVSNRSGSYEVYVSTFATSWSTPTLRTDLSTTGTEHDVAISPDGLTAVARDGDGADRFLFYSRASTTALFGQMTLHDELHITADVAAPTITNGAETIYFHAGAPLRQLYTATKRPNGKYTTPTLVTELNVATVRCAAPFVLQSNDYMMFERDDDIYETTRTLPAM